ncbi:PriCT-2 domain-containing protein [Pirellulales bacterium]|nr:PriCT-2 domain-containing protein [Pirellulales bacterium]
MSSAASKVCAAETRAKMLADRRKPPRLPVLDDNIPPELKKLDRWVGWRWKWVEKNGKGKWTKVPIVAGTQSNASTNDPSTWCSFRKALSVYKRNQVDGIGIVLGDLGDGRTLAGIDCDSCRDLESGHLTESAAAAVAMISSYTEVSPTATGVKILCIGTLPSGRRSNGDFECYDNGRYFTITGQRIDDCPNDVRDATAELRKFYHAFVDPPKYSSKLSDRELAASALGGLASWRADDYHDWIRVGLALKATSEDLLNEWDNWSRQSDKYASGVCEQKWQSFNGSGLSLGSLIHWAREDGWTPPRPQATEDTQQTQHTDSTENGSEEEPLPESDPWPDPLDDAAYHGLAGEIVRAIEPHSEADPAAILVQLLVGFGCLLGRRIHFKAEADRHYTNMFACMVGATSKGRKGVSWGQSSQLLASVDLDFISDRVYGGLSSGEGLIWQVRDPIFKRMPVKEKGRIVGHDDAEVDPGISDKRLIALESEFASVLKVAARERNTISAIIRQAWDTGNLRTMTKNSPAKATEAHISIIGHITREELRQQIAEVDLANGLANRFLWLCVRRSKCLPDGGNIDTAHTALFSQRLTEVYQFSLDLGEMKRDEGARDIWHAVYPQLSEGKPGLLGAATGRAEAQVMRLAVIYAVLDQSPQVKEQHLLAALALWQCCEASARHIFGSALGNPVADELLREIRRRGDDGMSRSEMRDHFGRHKRSGEIAAALMSLRDLGLIEARKIPTDGRPEERWFACSQGAPKAT